MLDLATAALKRLGMKPVFLVIDPVDKLMRVHRIGVESSLLRRATELVGIEVAEFSVAQDATETHRRVTMDQKTVFIKDAGALAAEVLPTRVGPLISQLMRLLGFSTVIMSPIVVDGSTMGIVAVHRKDMQESDNQAFELFSRQIGAAIARLRMIESLRTKNATILEAQERTLSSQRLEAMGKLAGGIAHDFNNLLTVIQNTGEAVLEEGTACDSVAEDIETIITAARSAASLTQQLLDFARQRSASRETFDAGERLLQLEGMLERTLGPQITLDIQSAASLALIDADPGQFDQIVMNIAFNARDAMPEGGTITMSLRLSGAENATVELAFRDTGSGMDPDTLARIFEPFFSTKPRGRGTGLGMASCYGIVTGLGGTIEVQSEPGKGTVVFVGFPRSNAAPKRKPESRSSREISAKGGRVLLIEDEEQVQETISRLLQNRGYKTECYDTGEAGLAAFLAQPTEYAVVLSDVVLPGMSGTQVATRILASHPKSRIILMSGHVGDAQEYSREVEALPFLWKPFSSEQLVSHLEDSIDATELKRSAD